MGENAFFTLNERPPGPPPPPPIPQGGGRMPVPPAMAHPHMHPHHQAPGPDFRPPPPPPRDILPLELRLPQTRVSDLSQELITDNDVRQRCTDFVAFRLEKVFEDQYVDEDEPIKSAWEKAVVSQIPGMSRKDLEKEIRRLDRDTVSLPEKKKSMSPILQRQLDRVMNDLAHIEPDPVNFQWTLEQVDHQLKEVGRGIAMTRQRVPLNKRDSNKHKRSSSYSKKEKRKEKKYYERVSVTAYFKRSPREGVNIRALFDTIQNAQAQALVQRGRQHVGGMPVPMHQPALPPPVGGGAFAGAGPGQGRGALPAGRGGGPLPTGAGPLPPPHPPPPPHLRPPPGGQGGRSGVIVMPPKPGANGGRKHVGSHGSHSGSESDDSTWSDGDSIFSTSPTHTTSSDSRTSRSSMFDKQIHRRSRSRHRSQSRNRRRSQSREDIRLFGRVPRNHTRHEQRYNLDNSPRLPAAPPPPLPVIVQTPPVIDLERVREEAYLDGRQDERASAHRVDALALEQRARLPRPRSPPRGLPPPRTGVRLIHARPLRYPEDDLSVGVDGLSLDDGYETEYRHYDPPLRRAFEYDEYSDSLESYEFAREVPYDRVGRRANEYMQRREAPRIYLQGDRSRERNPFSPLLRRAQTYDSSRGQRF